jgi:hypothetical protein
VLVVLASIPNTSWNNWSKFIKYQGQEYQPLLHAGGGLGGAGASRDGDGIAGGSGGAGGGDDVPPGRPGGCRNS